MEPVPRNEAIEQVLAESPLVDDFPARGLIPTESLLPRLVRAGWPIEVVSVSIEQPASVDSRGHHRPARVQTVQVKIVPYSWLRRFAELRGMRLAECTRGKYGF